MIANKPVISSRTCNGLLKLIISTFQDKFSHFYGYMAPHYALWAHQMSDLSYLKHLHTALYILKSVRWNSVNTLALIVLSSLHSDAAKKKTQKSSSEV